MSLRRILNDESIPAAQGSHSLATIEPAAERSSESTSAAIATSQPQIIQVESTLPYAHDYRSTSNQGAARWDTPTKAWIQDDAFPNSSGDNHPDELHRTQENIVGGSYQTYEGESPLKRRKKGTDDDPEYQPSGQRRVSSHCLSDLS